MRFRFLTWRPATLDRRLHPRDENRDDEALGLLGSALAAAHDPMALMPVLLETMVDATGALGGVVLEGEAETARDGDVPQLAEPLRLRLAAEGSSEITVLLFPAFGGFDEAARRRGEHLAAQAAVALQNARRNEIARRDAITDPLTGLANRRRLIDALANEVGRVSRFGGVVSIIIADLDDFKEVNDRFGHLTGDEVLCAFADVLRGCVREVDLPGRLGGEEFAVILPETEAEGALVFADRLRRRLEALRGRGASGEEIVVTASFGVSSSPPAGSSEQLLAAADAALYAAKRDGKNRVAEAAST